MNIQPEAAKVRRSEVLNRLVLNRRTAEEVGRVEQLWLNPQSHQVVGLTCKSGFLGNKKRVFIWEQIEAIGNDSILVNCEPEEIEPEKLEGVVLLMGHEVWTDAGNKAGKIVDYLFVPQTGKVISYLYMSSGWRGVLDGIYLLSANAIASVGSKRVIVGDAIVQEPEQYAEGFNQKVAQAADFLMEDYEKTQGDWEAIRRSTQNIGEHIKEKADKVRNIAQEKLAEMKAKEQDVAQAEDRVKTIDTTAEPVQTTTDLPEKKTPELPESHE